MKHQPINKDYCRRTTSRQLVLKRAVLVTPDYYHPVRLRNVSATGAEVIADGLLPPMHDVLLKRGAIAVAARVAWVKEDRIGLAFYRELTLGELALARLIFKLAE